MDASQAQSDVVSMAVLESFADDFRNYQREKYSVSAEELLLDKAQLLTLTAPEWRRNGSAWAAGTMSSKAWIARPANTSEPPPVLI